MKKSMKEQFYEIMGVTEEQQGLTGPYKELKDVKTQIKNLVALVKIFMVLTIIGIVLLSIGGIGIAADYVSTRNHDSVGEICAAIQGIIMCAAILYITVVCKKFCESILESETPFIPLVPKSLRKIAVVIAALQIISNVVSAVLSMILDMEAKFYVDGDEWFMVLILFILSSIFDYGCKLQKESDETL